MVTWALRAEGSGAAGSFAGGNASGVGTAFMARVSFTGFTRREGHVWVKDENSLNGTYVNKTLIDGEVALRRGDEVQIGKFRMIFAAPTGQG